MNNILKKGKKGQFFLISSLVIITILLSFVTTRSSIKLSPIKYKVFDLGEELNLETAEVLDYGIYTSETEKGMVLENWAKNFSVYQGLSAQDSFIFVYTEGNVAKGLIFSKQDSGDVSLDTGPSGIAVSNEASTENVIDLGILNEGENIKIIGNLTINIYYESGKPDFYFVIRSGGGEVAQKQE